MALPSFFSTSKNRSFNYIPRYYNPEREELENRIRQAELDMGINLKTDGTYNPRIQRGMMSQRFHSRRIKDRRSNRRVMLIVAVLLVVAYLLFFA